MDESLQKAAELLRNAQRVAVLTGAGISAESGVPTFRGQGGLWEGHRVEEVATPRAFLRDPTMVWRFYNQRRAGLTTIEPNVGHHALVELERRLGDRFTLITQNVDGLHLKAGSQRVLEIHGAIRRVRCTGCGMKEERYDVLPDLPKCKTCDALLRPDIVWFEEGLPQDVWAQAEVAVDACDVFLVVGTSAVVYPAAGLIHYALAKKASVIEVNLDRTEATHIVTIALQGRSGEILPQIVK